MKKRFLSLALALTLCLSLLPAASAAAGLDNFTKSNPYTPGQFTDVPAGAWFAGPVQAAYEYGLMQGPSATLFNAGGNVTIGETVVIASRLHAAYQGEGFVFEPGDPWYQPYVDYAAANGIAGGYPDYSPAISRAAFAMILTNALPEEALAPINSVEENAIPDIPSDANYHDAVYRLYRAGVVSGTNASGFFAPNNKITRSEVAVILSAMVDPSLRKSFSMKAVVNPTGLSISSGSVSLTTGDTQQLTAAAVPVNTTVPVTWSSDNTAVATVSAEGLVTGVSAGTATVTAQCGGFTAKATVTVTRKPPLSMEPTGFYYKRNSVNGITLSVDIRNHSGKTINYYTFNLSFLDPIGNPAVDEITYKSTKRVRYVGPIAPNRSLLCYTLVGYIPACGGIRIDSIELEYADGTKETVPYNKTTTRHMR